MRNILAVATVALASAACTNSIAVQRDAEIVSSIPFDTVPCGDLMRQRDQLAAQHGIQPDVTRQPQSESATPGFGIFIPDSRSAAEKARARAIGELSAMNQSMKRRNCGSA